MEGKALIQLFDAETKEEVSRYENKNLITNAYKKLIETVANNFNNPFIAYACDSSSATLNWKPIDFAKGILLFDEVLTESADTLLPDVGVRCIGHAGGDYSGTDLYRGDYNATESGQNGNTYKIVWDFATDKANGTIKSIALTTEKGGNQGYANSTSYLSVGYTSMDNTVISLFNPPGNGTYSTIQASGFLSPSASNILFVGYLNDLSCFYYQYKFSGTIKLRKYKAPSLGALGFLESPMMICDTNLDVSKTLGTNEYLQLSLVNNVIYGLLYNSSTKALYLKTYDLNLNELSSVTLTNSQLLNIANYQSWAMNENYVYALSSSSSPRVMYQYNKTTGAYIGAVSLPTNNITNLNQFGDKRMVLSNYYYNSVSGAYHLQFYLYDGINIQGPINTDNTYNSSDNPYGYYLIPGTPIAYFSHFYSSSIYYHIGLFAPVLGSVNNLATPVTKTPTNTMKVTYTISW